MVYVDGFNVISGVLLRGRSRERWWAAHHREALLRWLAQGGVACVVVFDGAREASNEAADGVEALYVSDADTWLVDHAVPGDVVVTRDRRLRDRLRTRGVRCRPPGWLEAQAGPFTST